MLKHLGFAILLLGSLCGFAQNQEAPAAPDRPSAVEQKTKSPDQSAQFAYLHVYRHRRYVGSALAPTISVDDVKVARVGSGRRFTAKLKPGAHTIKSDDKSSAISVDAVAGQHYYIRIDEETGFWKGHGRLTLLMPEQGKAEYQLQKPVESDRRFSKDMLEEESESPAPAEKG